MLFIFSFTNTLESSNSALLVVVTKFLRAHRFLLYQLYLLYIFRRLSLFQYNVLAII